MVLSYYIGIYYYYSYIGIVEDKEAIYNLNNIKEVKVSKYFQDKVRTKLEVNQGIFRFKLE